MDKDDALGLMGRVGYGVYGVVHLVVAWLALQVAFGHQASKASSTGALQKLAAQPLGEFLVLAVAVGMLLLAAWRLVQAAFGEDDSEDNSDVKAWGKRALSLGKAIVYAGLGVSAVQVALGDSSGGGTDSTTAKLMRLPFGPWLVGLVGVVLIGFGISLAVVGWTEKFLKDLDVDGRSGRQGTAFRWFGKIGHVAKGIAFGVIGGLFVQAAVAHDAKKSGGMDQALQKVVQQPYGPVLLAVIAAGLAAYGLFCFARARHLDD